MQLEFHQLDRRLERLRVRRADRQRRLLASLAATGQQTPIVVVEVTGEPGRYLVIDGYQRVAALEQLGRDTVEVVVWPMQAAEALVLDRSLRMGERATALEEGWLLAELEQHFGYGLEELARRFDRSVSWVSRRLALVELLPETVQQQAGRRDRGARGHEIPGANGARQRGGLPEDGGCAGGASFHNASGRPVVHGLAEGVAVRPEADSRGAAVVSESAAAGGAAAAGARSRRVVARPGHGGGDRQPSQPAIGRRRSGDGSR